ncbi:MAG: hypothetical protein HY985_00525 [Magnetospirillum sp.]|nr:hypothetical protein [Magnetospirillum sp.]
MIDQPTLADIAAADIADTPAPSPFRPFVHGIGWRMLALIVLFSSVVTLSSAALQLALDFRRDVTAIEGRLNEIQHSQIGALAAGLWHLDVAQLTVQLDGLMRLPDMQWMEIRETGAVATPVTISAGRPGSGAIVRTIPIVYEDRGTARTIGSLHIEATLDGAYRRLWERATVILASQAVKTFLVSLFTLYIVYRLVTRHLITLAAFLARLHVAGPAPRLVLDRPPPKNRDEFDSVVEAVNMMSANLDTAYGELRTANAALEDDIAERKRRDIELQGMVERLRESNAELERFADLASHDLQEPLRTLMIYSQILERRHAGDLGAETTECLTYVGDAARRMHALINDLLAFSRVTAKGAPFVPVDLTDACRRAVASLDETIRETGAEITVGALPTVPGDAVQLMQLFQHLLGNAVKFHRPGVPPKIAVDAGCDGGQWTVRVADNGIGMERSDQDVFQIFRRLHTAQAYPGTGVGLAICRSIVRHHGGTIRAESGPGAGSTFFFTLNG